MNRSQRYDQKDVEICIKPQTKIIKSINDPWDLKYMYMLGMFMLPATMITVTYLIIYIFIILQVTTVMVSMQLFYSVVVICLIEGGGTTNM